MEFPMKVIIILLLGMITLVVVLTLSGAWSGRSSDIVEGIFGFIKSLGGPVS